MNTVLKWCKILPFPKEWRKTIIESSKEFDINKKPMSPMDNLLKTLNDCEKLAENYKKKGIDESILYDTLEDIVVWTKNHYTVNGKIGLSEMDWIKYHMAMELFRLGRLQFKCGVATKESERLGIKKGDPIVEVHVPQDKPLDTKFCIESFKTAIAFFEKYFPQFNYQFFTCESWLLDFNLKNFLGADSNIIKFQSLFDVVYYFESGQTLERLFTYNTEKTKESSLQKAVKNHIKKGGKLFEGYGFVDKNMIMKGV